MNLKEFSKKTGIPVSTISKALGNYKDVYFSQKDTLAKDSSYWSLIYSSRSIISPLKKFAKFFELSS